MGCGESAVDIEGDVEERAAGLPKKFTREQFQQRRTSSDEATAVAALAAIGKNLAQLSPSAVTGLGKALFICCNTYTTPKLSLGVGPLNDAHTVAKNHADRGYTVYFLHNPKPDVFMQWLPHFLKQTQTALTVFYTGHGANIKDKDGDEDDGFDEAMVFDNGYIVDDKLLDCLKQNANGKARVLLLSDCCHSGSIWDLQSAIDKKVQLPANLVSMSAAADSQTAKQTTVNQMSQGLFTFYLWKSLNAQRNATPNNLTTLVSPNLQRFNQKVVVAASTPGLLNQPVFLSFMVKPRVSTFLAVIDMDSTVMH
jgi:hypothetical protein